ncbi:hypothetical protein E2C01_047139 [Portunus trituberculatus]|uniref:Uncharacterized protein n=1 Tax=Portunus trituberculatus TaxID=210409 RepID=A0A5B7FZM2_PORTR|nr:hypothetical protein [Portunus trituberculatus]
MCYFFVFVYLYHVGFHGNLWAKRDTFFGYLISQSPPARKPLPRVRKPRLHSPAYTRLLQDSNLWASRPLRPQSTHGSTVPRRLPLPITQFPPSNIHLPCLLSTSTNLSRPPPIPSPSQPRPTQFRAAKPSPAQPRAAQPNAAPSTSFNSLQTWLILLTNVAQDSQVKEVRHDYSGATRGILAQNSRLVILTC